MRKRKVLIFHPALAPYRVDLFNALADRLDLRVMFLMNNLISQEFDQDALRSKLKIDYGYLLKGVRIFGRLLRTGLCREILRFGPDVVVTHEYSPVTLEIALLKSIVFRRKFGMTVWTDDNLHMLEHCGQIRKVARTLALKVADSVIVCNQQAKTWLFKRKLPRHGVFVSGIYQEEMGFTSELRAAWKLSREYLTALHLDGKKLVLYVGRLVKIKGVDNLIQAFADGCREMDNTVLVIVGDGCERANLEKSAKDTPVHDRIIFAGRLEGQALMAWYLLGDLFVLASYFEPFGAVVNEALLAGMPVLCSNHAGACGLIQEGVNGATFDPHDVNRLSLLIRQYATDAKLHGHNDVCVRESLMPDSFDIAANSFVEAVESAAINRG